MKKFIAAVATVFIAVALSVVAVAGPASAHTATLTGAVSCNSSDGSGTIVWTVVNDYAETANITASDNATIPVGTTIDATSGHGNTSKTFTQHIAAPAAGVSVTTTLSFEWTGDGVTQPPTNQHSFATAKISNDCKAKNASAALIDHAAACASPESVELGAVTNASFGTLTVSNGHYSAVATATTGHVFTSANGGVLSAGNTVDTFAGTLSGPLSPSSAACRVASAAVITTAATCQAPELVKEDTVGIKFATWAPITYKTTGGVTTYTAVATANTGYQFPNGAGVGPYNTTLTLTGPIAPKLTGHPCEGYVIVAWTMPTWVNSTTPTWGQTYFTSEQQSSPNLAALDSKLVVTCGVQYQVDIYFDSSTTASLIASHHLAGPNSPPEDLIPGGWGVAYKLVQGPACAPIATPSESDVCSAGGTITVYASTGVKYYLNGTAVDTSNGNVTLTGLHGANTVTATALSGYLLTGYPAGGWSYNVNSDCTATYASSGECTAGDSSSQETVKLNLVNTSGTAATFVVTSTDSTVTPSGSYIVPAHTTSQVVVGSTTEAGGTFNVSVNGGAAIAVPVASFAGCIAVIPSDPEFTPLSCTGQTTNLGSITTDGNVRLTYTLTGPGHAGTVFPSLPNPTISGLAAGSYLVSVTANGGYVLSGPNSFPVTIVLPAVNCALPTLASWHSGAAATPATCTATGALGTITLVHGSDAAHPTDENGKVTYTLVNNSNGHATNLGSSSTSVHVGPGSYTVEAVPTDPADGLVGNANVHNEIDYPLTIAAAAGSCGDRLAFTGGTIAWFGFVLAGGMLFLGIAFLLMRRRQQRSAE